jgi:glycosyltransferase involved in cell wall biosynthesis
MISIVIRNKNEAALNVLTILTKVYAADFDEIIVVDNNSTDDSRIIAGKFKIINIESFTYVKTINLGVETAKNNYVLL